MSFQPSPEFAALTFDQKLDRLAEVAVRIGLGLREGQELVLSAPTDALPLVRLITEHAYKVRREARDHFLLRRLHHARALSVRPRRELRLRARVAALGDGCGIQVWGCKNGHRWLEPRAAQVAGPQQSFARERCCVQDDEARDGTHHAPRNQLDASSLRPRPKWAELVFPGEPENVAVGKLWDAIFAASRITSPDPVAEWKEHGANLKRRVDFLNEKRFHSLRFFTPDSATDLDRWSC